jgi:hypothetical protein
MKFVHIILLPLLVFGIITLFEVHSGTNLTWWECALIGIGVKLVIPVALILFILIAIAIDELRKIFQKDENAV